MFVELGNPAPLRVEGPAVTYVHVPDVYGYEPHGDAEVLAGNLARHLATVGDVTRCGDVSDATGHHEAFLAVVRGWGNEGARPPSWVWSDNADFAKLLGAFWGVPWDRPADMEMTHFTQYGSHVLRPGVMPSSISPVNTKTDAGRNIQWAAMFGGVGGAGVNVTSGTSTATGATSMTDSGASWGTTQYVGLSVVCAGNRMANIRSHTGTVLTVDQWYDITNFGSTSAGSTPGATSAYTILPYPLPSVFMGLSADTTAVSSSDTTLPSEITTASGGLIRKICPLAHTSGASTGTLTPVFTANGSDSLPVTIGKAGISPSIKSTVNNLFQTLVSPTATLSASGDQLTLTDTVTM